MVPKPMYIVVPFGECFLDVEEVGVPKLDGTQESIDMLMTIWHTGLLGHPKDLDARPGAGAAPSQRTYPVINMTTLMGGEVCTNGCEMSAWIRNSRPERPDEAGSLPHTEPI